MKCTQEPVINFPVGGAGSQFPRVQGERSDAYFVSASDERRGNRGNWPQPEGLRIKSRHTSLSSSPWNSQSLRPSSRLTRFSRATPPTGKLITGSVASTMIQERICWAGALLPSAWRLPRHKFQSCQPRRDRSHLHINYSGCEARLPHISFANRVPGALGVNDPDRHAGLQ